MYGKVKEIRNTIKFLNLKIVQIISCYYSSKNLGKTMENTKIFNYFSVKFSIKTANGLSTKRQSLFP
jgi:hypothetical protein